ncbi:MAG: hypothetical protein QM776_12785 [Rhodocyclaceae bacterium]
MSEPIALPIPADHPVFAGHFPGQPIVPGALLLDLAIVAIEAQLGRKVSSVAQAKFLSPALPGEPVSLSFDAQADSVRLTLLSGERSLATARLNLQAA